MRPQQSAAVRCLLHMYCVTLCATSKKISYPQAHQELSEEKIAKNNQKITHSSLQQQAAFCALPACEISPTPKNKIEIVYNTRGV